MLESTLDLDVTRARLEGWLRARAGAEDARVLHVSVPERGGLSHDTLLIDAVLDGRPLDLVARVEPAGAVIFPSYDLAREWTVIERLAAATDVPVPALRWFEGDPTVLGRRFYVMDRVPGEVPGDDPPFLLGGFLFDATPEAQARAQQATVELLATIHRIDWQTLGLGAVLGSELGGQSGPATGIDGELATWRRYLDWAGADAPLPVLEAVYAWCAQHRPVDEPEPVLCWGDARYGNIVYDPQTLLPAAVLDWEMALLGPPELDVGWFCFIHDTARMWLPELPGFVGRAELIARYEAALGRPLVDLAWYEVWAGLRAGAIQAQIVRRTAERDLGVRSGSDALAGREDTPVIASLRRLVDLGP